MTTQRSLVVFVALLLGLGLWGCGQQRGRSGRFDGLAPLQYEAKPVFLAETSTYCRQSGGEPQPARAQILLDASGSMSGYREVIPTLVTWMQHGVSLLRQSTLEVEEGRICQFNKGLGELDGVPAQECRPSINQPLPGYVAKSDTNLHLAILAAKDYDLTLIVTDGVAATGAGGSGNCASGVDAGCVARSLREVLNSRQSLSEVNDWGLWVLPLIAPFNGPYYTEQRIDKAGFKPAVAKEQVLAEIGTEPEIGKGETHSDQTLKFSYKGPRSFLLLILARQSDAGRAMVQALSDRSDIAGIKTIATLKEYAGKTSLLPPLELFPGFVDSISWKALNASTEVAARGTIDASLVESGGDDAPQIRIGCPPGEVGEGYFALRGDLPRTTRVAGCVEILLVPAVKKALQAKRSDQASEMSTMVAGYRPLTGNPPSLDLHLRCGPRLTTSCSKPLKIAWQAEMHYGPAADCLADSSCSSGAVPAIQRLSTSQPSVYPHRIFGIAETIQELFRLMSSDVPVQTIADLEMCRSEE